MDYKPKNLRVRFIIAIVFTVAYVAGVTFGILGGELNLPSSENNDDLLNLYNSETYYRAIELMKNNLIVCTKILLLSVLSLGFISLILVFFNGYTLGIAIGDLLSKSSLHTVLSLTLPHSGEIIGLIMCAYIGTILSLRIVFKKKYHSLRTILIITSVSLLLIISAAFAESYISMTYNK
ncbi:hypothetical protein CJ231_08280 [Hoylesella buccalis]|uniref:Stage II sporulation protein M n=1 Tax=Hoylesella buccalis TaxID=28127 RepID=A0A2N6QQ76_9BACT|nr:hypothetical protein CJ231_08280 [Hoylesella buccalis]